MLVTFIKNDRISSISLPEKINGQYWVTDFNEQNTFYNLIGIEAINNRWVLKSNDAAKIKGNVDYTHNYLKYAELSEHSFCYLEISATKEIASIFTEPITEERKIYHKKSIIDDCEFTIGRKEICDISFASEFISSQHCKLKYTNNIWSIVDLNSTNGTYVNGIRIAECQLFPGDCIFIMGFKIIVGNNFIAYNNPDNKISINNNKIFFPYVCESEVLKEDNTSEVDFTFFYRSPRFQQNITSRTFEIDSPPPVGNGEELPIMMTVGPSMTMGLASMTTGIFAVNNAITTGNIAAAIPSVVMSFSMLLGMVMWPIVTKKYEKKRSEKNETQRQATYREYLKMVGVDFEAECRHQEEILRENYITISECYKRIEEKTRNLWERSFGQSDFLKVRLGIGEMPLFADVSYSERHFVVKPDVLQEEMFALCEAPKLLENVPISFSLFEHYLTGIMCADTVKKNFVKGIILQLATLYSYDELKMVFLFDQKDEQEYDFIKWLPHIWNEDHSFRFLATNLEETKEISSYLDQVLENRSSSQYGEPDNVLPYYIIFVLDKSLSLRCEILKKVYNGKQNISVSILHIFDELKDFPKECTSIIQLNAKKGIIFNRDETYTNNINFIPDILIEKDLGKYSKILANITLDEFSANFSLPKTYTFLEMYGVGKVEHLNIRTRWKESNPIKSLEAPVGINSFGDIFKLDLHEKKHGPHGLVAGMTGSGKSEFIITYILSLAVNYHPNEVAFILIDYKGGGMAKSFENLPHLAGIITNLDGASINRSLSSINSEMKRRQGIFNRTKEKVGISNIDIYKYQELYRDGIVNEPLQHLFIISDEFAELKVQQPEFMAGLISAARIGRSLGVHLILATQKPSGVVDDQIWSNSKFRVCLKVQEKSDSMDMLKRADAAELSDTGRFYLQVGYNELFEIGQSAWAGASYYPSEKMLPSKNKKITIIGNTGNIIREAKIEQKQVAGLKISKQLDVITRHLQEIAKSDGIAIRPLWLKPIPPIIYLEDLQKKYNVLVKKYVLNPIVGEFDDPTKQQQCVLRLPLSEKGNLIIYGAAKSGKVSFIETVITSLIQNHTPDEVNLYLLDFGTQTLKAYANAPHVGDVVFSFEQEKVKNLYMFLMNEIKVRQKLFADFGGDYSVFIKNSMEKLPCIVVVLNGFDRYKELYSDYEDALKYLCGEGLKYGIYFIITAQTANSVNYSLRDHFKQLFVLQMNDSLDYNQFFSKVRGMEPSKIFGRGLVSLNESDDIYEFQTAYCTKNPNVYGTMQKLCNELMDNWHGAVAPKIKTLPECVSYEYVKKYAIIENPLILPIGVDTSSLDLYYFNFAEHYINLIMSNSNEYQKVSSILLQIIENQGCVETLIFDVNGNYKKTMGIGKNYFYNSLLCRDNINLLYNTILNRNNQIKDAELSGEKIEPYSPLIVYIDSLKDLVDAMEIMDSKEENLPQEQKGFYAQKLQLSIEKGSVKLNVNFIIGDIGRSINSIAYMPWFSKNYYEGEGLWIGSGIADQLVLKAAQISPDIRKNTDSKFGAVFYKGKATMLKILNEDKDD